jgi:serine/threonine protein kinase
MRHEKTNLRLVLEEEKLSEDQKTKSIIYNLIKALNHLHASGIMHRDLKPANVLLDEFDRVKICDFGLSRNYLEEDGCVPAF